MPQEYTTSLPESGLTTTPRLFVPPPHTRRVGCLAPYCCPFAGSTYARDAHQSSTSQKYLPVDSLPLILPDGRSREKHPRCQHHRPKQWALLTQSAFAVRMKCNSPR